MHACARLPGKSQRVRGPWCTASASGGTMENVATAAGRSACGQWAVEMDVRCEMPAVMQWCRTSFEQSGRSLHVVVESSRARKWEQGPLRNGPAALDCVRPPCYWVALTKSSGILLALMCWMSQKRLWCTAALPACVGWGAWDGCAGEGRPAARVGCHACCWQTVGAGDECGLVADRCTRSCSSSRWARASVPTRSAGARLRTRMWSGPRATRRPALPTSMITSTPGILVSVNACQPSLCTWARVGKGGQVARAAGATLHRSPRAPKRASAARCACDFAVCACLYGCVSLTNAAAWRRGGCGLSGVQNRGRRRQARPSPDGRPPLTCPARFLSPRCLRPAPQDAISAAPVCASRWPLFVSIPCS